MGQTIFTPPLESLQKKSREKQMQLCCLCVYEWAWHDFYLICKAFVGSGTKYNEKKENSAMLAKLKLHFGCCSSNSNNGSSSSNTVDVNSNTLHGSTGIWVKHKAHNTHTQPPKSFHAGMRHFVAISTSLPAAAAAATAATVPCRQQHLPSFA